MLTQRKDDCTSQRKKFDIFGKIILHVLAAYQ